MKLRQPGHDLPAQQVPPQGGVPVCLVLHVGQTVGFQVCLDFLPGGFQQGTDDPAPHRGDPCQALHPGAPDQVQHHRLRLVGGVVGGGDALGPQPVRRAAEEVVPGHAPGLLQPHAPLTGQGGHIRPLHRQGNVQLPAQLLHKGHVPARRGPLAVVQVGRRHGKIPGHGGQIVQQAHGVPPAGHGHQHHPAGRRQHMPPLHKRAQVHQLSS